MLSVEDLREQYKEDCPDKKKIFMKSLRLRPKSQAMNCL